MANKFWTPDGGVDNLWSNTANWSTTSGGTGGAGQPGTADNAIFDAGSAAYACEVNATEVCLQWTCTGYTGTFTLTTELKTYGSVTIVSGMTLAGAGILWFFEDNSGGNITTNGKSIPWDVYFGGVSGFTLVLQDDMTLTKNNALIWFQATTDTTENTINGLGGTEKLIIQGTTCVIRTANTTGITRGDMIIECQENIELWFRHSSDTYGWGFQIQMLVAKTLTIRGYNGTAVCRVANSFNLIMADVATLAFEAGSIPDSIPYFHCCDAAVTAKIDTGDQVVTYRVIFPSVVTSTAVWVDDTDGAENTIFIFRREYTSAGVGQWQLTNNGSKLFVDQITTVLFVGSPSLDFRGTADIEVRSLIFTRNGNGNVTSWDFQAGRTYTFTDVFRLENNQEGETTFASTSGVDRANIHIAHHCQLELFKVHMIRMDGRSNGQGIGLIGPEGTITDCQGIFNGQHNLAYWFVDSDVATSHPLYTNENLGTAPITVSGTVKIGGTPQANARVLVITKRTETWKDGAVRDWFMLRYVLITDGSGEFTCQVPTGEEVILEAHFDSGSQKYNSLSKPYIDAS